MEIETGETETIRTFLALPIHHNNLAAIKNLQRNLMTDLKHCRDSVIWTEKRHLHLTIFFLGHQSLKKLDILMQHMNATIQMPDIHFLCAQMQLFPTEDPLVIALTGDCPPALYNLRRNIAQCLKFVGIQPDVSHETHGFLPHITLGTLKRPTDLKNESIHLDVPLNQLVLFKSERYDANTVVQTPLCSWGGP